MDKEQLEKLLEEYDDGNLIDLANQVKSLVAQDSGDKPETDDELHQWIKDNLGVDIPRVNACPDHCAPFDPIADLFFDRVQAALLMANRGGGKSFSAALWNFLNCRFIEGVECLSVGAIEIQAKRVYGSVKQFNGQAAQEYVLSSLISETTYTTGAKYEIITGSKSSVNGPHPQKVHRDEIELMDKEVYQESLQMERSKKFADGRVIKAQTFLTSTRKTSDGLMQSILDDCKLAEDEGREPPFKVYVYCIKDVVERQENCRVANPDLPEFQKCKCNVVKSGEWAEGKPRLLEHVCGGAFAKADGFIPLEDLINSFTKSSKAMWEAQQECKRPYIEDISIPEFSRERHGIRNYMPDPANGPIYTATDFGGTSPHAVEWLQYLDFEVETENHAGEPIRIPEGSYVVFDEIYEAEIGNIKLADLIIANEDEWREVFPSFRIEARFADPQAKAARLDFKARGLPCVWPAVTRDREEHKKRLHDAVIDDLFFVDLDRCEMFVEEIEVWNINVAKKKFDHAVDATIYGVSNIHVLQQVGMRRRKAVPSYRKGTRTVHTNPFDDTIPKARPNQKPGQLPASEKWREQMGAF